MKRYGDLIEKCCSMENLYRAHQNASSGKRHYREVKMVNNDPEKYLRIIQEMILNGAFRTSTYSEMQKNEYGKTRKIHKLPYFPDRIVHHAIVQVVACLWNRNMIRDTYACIVGRGIHDGVRRIKKALRDFDATRYCLKMDVRQFYHSIDHEILKQIVRKKIKDKRLLTLTDEIIDSFSPGVPIGNYLSQFFGNLYLSGYDHFMKEVHSCRYYFRYCDDIVILCSNKRRLHDLRKVTCKYMGDILNLRLKNNWQVFPVDGRGIDYLGYRFFHKYTLLRKSIAVKVKRKMRYIRSNHHRMQPVSVVSSVMSYEGWMRHANCLNLKNSVFDPDLKMAVEQAAKAGNMRNPMLKGY